MLQLGFDVFRMYSSRKLCSVTFVGYRKTYSKPEVYKTNDGGPISLIGRQNNASRFYLAGEPGQGKGRVRVRMYAEEGWRGPDRPLTSRSLYSYN